MAIKKALPTGVKQARKKMPVAMPGGNPVARKPLPGLPGGNPRTKPAGNLQAPTPRRKRMPTAMPILTRKRSR